MHVSVAYMFCHQVCPTTPVMRNVETNKYKYDQHLFQPSLHTYLLRVDCSYCALAAIYLVYVCDSDIMLLVPKPRESKGPKGGSMRARPEHG